MASVALALLLAAAPGLAQGPERDGPEGGRRPAAREELFKMVDAYILSNLQDSLGLTDEQFVKMLPLVKKLQTDRREYGQRRFRTLGELRRMMRAGAADPGVGDLMKSLHTLESEEPQTMLSDMAAIDAMLTPVQQAKFRLLEVEVERRIRELVSRVRRPMRPGEGPRREPEDRPRQPEPPQPSPR
jgi:Spy/CpxP family protein refolding chaperone